MRTVFPWSFNLRNYIPLVVCHHNIVTIFAPFVSASSYSYELLLLSWWLYTTCLCILFFIITVEAQFSLKCHCRIFGECNHHYSELIQHRGSCLLINHCIILFIISTYQHLVRRNIAEHFENAIASPESCLIDMFHEFHAFLWTVFDFMKHHLLSKRGEWNKSKYK